MPAWPIACSSTEIAADGHAQDARPGRAGRRREGARARDVEPRTYVARVWGTAAGIAPRLIHSATSSCWAISTTAAANSCQRKSGSAPERTSRSRLVDPAAPDRQGRPGQLGDAGRRRSRASDAGSDSRTGGRRRTRRRRRRRPRAAPAAVERGAAGIDPAIERGDEGRSDEIVRRIEAVERHPRRIGQARSRSIRDQLRAGLRIDQSSVRPMTCPSGSATRPSWRPDPG